MPPGAEDEEGGGLPPDPTPEQRADFVVRRLEQFIRDGRTVAEGMSFRQWQDMARGEIAEALKAAENVNQRGDAVTRRLLFTVAAAFVTVGFWGALYAYDKVEFLAVALIVGVTGLVLLGVLGEWRIMAFIRRRQAHRRRRSLHRVEDLTRRIRKMERELEDKHDALEKKIKGEAP